MKSCNMWHEVLAVEQQLDVSSSCTAPFLSPLELFYYRSLEGGALTSCLCMCTFTSGDGGDVRAWVKL